MRSVGEATPGTREAADTKPALDAEELLKTLQALEADLHAAEAVGVEAERVHPVHRRSVSNLAHYLALRGRDIRSLQMGLARLGLSSLGRSEGHILASVQQVRSVLEQLAGQETTPAQAPPVSFDDSFALLATKTEALFGPAPSRRATRIMVTMPAEAASDYDLVEDLVRRGMDCARINAAHDGPDAWAAMASHVRRAAAELGRTCPVEIDLAGPKLRTRAGPDRRPPATCPSTISRAASGSATSPAAHRAPPGTRSPPNPTSGHTRSPGGADRPLDRRPKVPPREAPWP